MDSMEKRTNSESFTGLLLILATISALIICNSPLKDIYHNLLENIKIYGFNLNMIINDFLMAIFFLLIGCEIKKEILDGSLSDLKKASLPIIGALGGIIVPSIIFIMFNRETEFINGFGIPISTDIAFAVGIFMIFKNYLEPSLKVFLLSLAVVDDLLSIIIIGVFYSSKFNVLAIICSIITFIILVNIKKFNKKETIIPYIVLGLLLWYFIHLSGIHATITGVLLAITIPYNKDKESLVHKVEHTLTPICNYVILPIFAFSNTGINLSISMTSEVTNTLMLGIISGLVIGKPLGITLFTYIATKLNLAQLPEDTNYISILKVSILAGIGFTMSIFVSELAFVGDLQLINIAKISILTASILSCALSYTTIILIPKISHKLASKLNKQTI